jgi:hypothetical protein
MASFLSSFSFSFLLSSSEQREMEHGVGVAGSTDAAAAIVEEIDGAAGLGDHGDSDAEFVEQGMRW